MTALPEGFHSRLRLSSALALPVLLYSEMVQEWLDYSAPAFPGDGVVAPVLGTVVYIYGGWPFLAGAVVEARERRPGMMLLIAMRSRSPSSPVGPRRSVCSGSTSGGSSWRWW